MYRGLHPGQRGWSIVRGKRILENWGYAGSGSRCHGGRLRAGISGYSISTPSVRRYRLVFYPKGSSFLFDGFACLFVLMKGHELQFLAAFQIWSVIVWWCSKPKIHLLGLFGWDTSVVVVFWWSQILILSTFMKLLIHCIFIFILWWR